MTGSRGSPEVSTGGGPLSARGAWRSPSQGRGAETTPGSPTWSRAGTPPGSRWVRRSREGSLHTPCPAARCLRNDRAGQRGGRDPGREGSWASPLSLGLGLGSVSSEGVRVQVALLLSRETRGLGRPGSTAHLWPAPSGQVCRACADGTLHSRPHPH